MTVEPHPDEVAIVLRGLELDVWDMPEVTAWADAEILSTDTPPAWLIECALSGHRRSAHEALVAGSNDSTLREDAGLALALLAERLDAGKTTPREAIRAAFAVVVSRESDELVDAVYQLDDGLDLAEQGIVGSTAEFERDGVAFFRTIVQRTPAAARLSSFLRERGSVLRRASRRTRG
jgi:hypothetical protein